MDKPSCSNCLYWIPFESQPERGTCEVSRLFAPSKFSQLSGNLITSEKFLCNEWKTEKDYQEILVTPSKANNFDGNIGLASVPKKKTKKPTSEEPRPHPDSKPLLSQTS